MHYLHQRHRNAKGLWFPGMGLVNPWRWLLGLSLVLACNIATADFSDQVKALNARSFSQKSQAIASLAETAHPRSAAVLEAMLKGRLYYRRNNKRIVIVEPVDSDFVISDASTGEDLGRVGKREVRRININNALRTQLRTRIAQLTLQDPDPRVRLAAVQQLIDELSPEITQLLEDNLSQEQDQRVREAMITGLALGELNAPDPAVRLAAVETLRGNLDPQVRNRLTALLAEETDPQVRTQAEQVLTKLENTRRHYQRLETLFFGLSLGSVLFLAAIGLAITFGVMGVINMAHGELIMLGAYTTYGIQQLLPQHLELSLLIAIPAAFLVSGTFGIAIERGIIRFLYGRPLETLLATFGISLFLQQLVRTVISPQNVPVSNPGWMSGSWIINDALSLTYNRLYIFIFALAVFALLMIILRRTTLGLHVRAVAQNRSMARAMGIHTAWVDAMTFGLGAGIAGVAGVALSQLTNVGPNLGQSYIVDSFLVVVFGGVGNLWGTLVGAMTLGVANKFLEPFSGAVLAKILVLAFIILFIQKRPRGLFPPRGRAAES